MQTVSQSDTNGIVVGNPFFVIRHSERIDESHPKEWEEMIKQYSAANSSRPSVTVSRKNSKDLQRDGFKLPAINTRKEICSTVSPRLSSAPKRGKQFFSADPPLSTKNGPRFANSAAETVHNMLKDSLSTLTVRIYCSRLRRAVQTAVPIARKLNLPIHLSYGLSTIINAVYKSRGSFEFQSSQELLVEFPGVTFISCDDPSNEYFLPTEHWIPSIHAIIQKSQPADLNIIVGHRETIRGVAGRHMNTPYCAIAVFDRIPLQQSTEGDDNIADDDLDEIKETRMPHPPGSKVSQLPPRAVQTKTSGIVAASKKKPTRKQREGPMYRMIQLYDCEGRSILSSVPS